MSNVRISELNQLLRVTTDDFVPIVDSGSLTTYRTPASALLTFVADSGSVVSSSWASSSLSSSYSKTSSYSLEYRNVQTIIKNLYNTNSYCQDMARIYNTSGLNNGFGTMMVSMRVDGDLAQVRKIHLITSDIFSPGTVIDPVTSVPLDGTAYNGWYAVKALSANRNYAPGTYNTDYELEMSQSYVPATSITQLNFRIRCDVLTPPAAAQAAAGYLSFWMLDDGGDTVSNWNVSALPDNKTQSSKNIPPWPTAFVEIKQNRMTVSGSLTVQKPITGSLEGTASWALNVAPSGNSIVLATWASASLSSSWASSSFSASYAKTASYANTASYAHTASYSQTSSFAFNSVTASYITGSAITNTIPGIVKAWATCVCTASMPGNTLQLFPGVNANVMRVVNGYNVVSVIRTMGERPEDPANGEVYTGGSSARHWLVTLSTPLPSTNYTVLGTGGEGGPEGSYMTIFPFAPRTTTQFTISMANNSTDYSGGPEVNWFNFMVLGT